MTSTDHPALSPELELAVRIACADWSAQAARRWGGAWDRPLDWQEVLWLASRHQIRPMVASALKECGWPNGSVAIRADMEAAGAWKTVAAITHTDTLRRIHRAAVGRGLRMLALKGPALSMLLYRQPCIRESFDLDIWIDEGDVEGFDALLTDLGFQSADPPLSRFQSLLLSRFIKDRRYYDPVHKVWVECHRRFFDNPYLLPLTFDEAWRRRDEVMFGEDAIPIPSGADLILYLGCHAAGHGWTRLKWLGDMATLVSRLTPGEFSALRQRAGEFGLCELLGSWLILVAGLAGIAVPAGELTWARAQKRAGRLANGAARGVSLRIMDSHLNRGIRADFTVASIYAMGLKRDWRFIAFWLVKKAHGEKDWQNIRLPDILFPLYYILRPVLWAWRRFRSP